MKPRRSSSLSRLASFLLALLLSGAFAACGSSPPAPQARGAVYGIGVAGDGKETLFALRASDGALLWQTLIPLDSESAVASVTVTPSLVYVVSGGKPSSADWSVMAIRASDGKLAWTFAADSLITSIHVAGDSVYLGTLYAGGVRALRVSDGRVRWQHEGDVAALLLAGDTLYAAFTGGAAGDEAVVALQASAGTERWHDQLEPDAAPSQMLVDQSTLYVALESETMALQISDGAQLWRSQDASGVLNGAVAGNVYLSQIDSQTARLVALRASDGLSLWQHAVLRGWFPFPLITAGAVYLTVTTDRLCALHPGDGSTAWCYQAHQVEPLAADDQAAYVSDETGAVCALRAGDGSRRWCQQALSAESLVVAADRLFLATTGAVCALQTASGKQVWCHHVAQTVFDLTPGS
jgi:outer membrane protein assembly factor BamB